MKNLLAKNLGTLDPGYIHLEPTMDPVNQLENVISVIIGVLTAMGGLWFTIQIITAAYSWMSAEGDKAKVMQARQKIVHNGIGLIILVAAYSLTAFVGGLLGFNIFDLQGSLGSLW